MNKNQNYQGQNSETQSFHANEKNEDQPNKKRRLSFNVNNSVEMEHSISKEIEIFHSDAPKNKEEVIFKTILKSLLFELSICNIQGGALH